MREQVLQYHLDLPRLVVFASAKSYNDSSEIQLASLHHLGLHFSYSPHANNLPIPSFSIAIQEEMPEGTRDATHSSKA